MPAIFCCVKTNWYQVLEGPGFVGADPCVRPNPGRRSGLPLREMLVRLPEPRHDSVDVTYLLTAFPVEMLFLSPYCIPISLKKAVTSSFKIFGARKMA